MAKSITMTGVKVQLLEESIFQEYLPGPNVINIYGCKSIAYKLYISVNYAVIRNFLFTNQLSVVIT
jgi:hypothetical protein